MNACRGKRTRSHAGGAGFTIVEMLIALMLVSMLLTSIALAMRASMQSYEQNRHASAVNQNSRALAMRIQREVRQAEAVDFSVPSNKLVITPPTNASGLKKITYEYVGTSRTLTYSLEYIDSSKDVSETLFDPSSQVQLSGFYVTYNTVQNDQGLWCTRRVISTTYFTVNGQTTPLVFSASPRRNLSY